MFDDGPTRARRVKKYRSPQGHKTHMNMAGSGFGYSGNHGGMGGGFASSGECGGFGCNDGGGGGFGHCGGGGDGCGSGVGCSGSD